MSDTKQMIKRYMEDNDWTATTVVGLLCNFIDEHELASDVDEFLSEVETQERMEENE